MILVTGGTGVIGRATVTELRRRGHRVRLFSRGAHDAHDDWNGGVEPYPGDVADPAAVHGAADGCAAVIHIAGISEESGPDATFERINVTGVRNVLAEAERAGVRRFVLVSSLGVDRGESAYHRSKREAERIVRTASLGWTIARVGAVMGAGDETVSVLLRMIRTLPAVPVIGDGSQPFQPVWHEDVAWALAECIDREDTAGQTLRLAGPDVVTVKEVIDLFGAITNRSPLRVRVPSFLARAGTSLASAVGFGSPVSTATVHMLLEGNYLREGESNDLIERLGGRPAPTRDRLVQLVDDLPEQTPDEGVGSLRRRRFHVDIAGAAHDARSLLNHFATRFTTIVPFDAAAEPGAATRLAENATITLELPPRGHVQVRVEAVEERSITLATLRGHPLAGIVRFRFEDRANDIVRFTIDIAERPASRIDQISMALGGSLAQSRTWRQTAENVVAEAGGASAGGVIEESWDLDDDAAEPVEDWVRSLIRRRRRETRSPSPP